MAITATVTLNVNVQDTATAFKDAVNPAALSVTLSAIGSVGGVQAIGTSSEDVSYGDIAAANVGLCYLQNLDSTNYIEYGVNDSATIKIIGRLKAGEFAFIRITASAQLMARANTAACNLLYRIWRD